MVSLFAMAATETNVESSGNYGIPKEFVDALIKFLISSPYMLVSALLAYVSGHLWAYIILSYFSKKERKILYSLFGKIGLGLLWFTVILIPTHIITYGDLTITAERLTEISLTVLVISLALQAIFLSVIYALRRKG